MERTKWTGSRDKDLKFSDQTKGRPQPPLELEYNSEKSLVNLPSPYEIKVSPINLREAIEKRRSIRTYSEKPITLDELSWLLWCTQGVKSITNVPTTLRIVPSGGARHPFETYILVNRVEGLQQGFYRFLSLSHKLLEHNFEEGLAERVTDICWNQPFVKQSALSFIWTFIPYRGIWRYGERAFRNIIEVGHICQNLYLSAEAIDCGVCAIGAFGDDAINDVLGVDGIEQFVVYMATVGKRK